MNLDTKKKLQAHCFTNAMFHLSASEKMISLHSRLEMCLSFMVYSMISIQNLPLKTVTLNSRALGCDCFFLLQRKIWALRDHGKPTI